jgi:hypothetical protein
VAGSCEYGDEPSGSGATELVCRSVSQSVSQPASQSVSLFVEQE